MTPRLEKALLITLIMACFGLNQIAVHSVFSEMMAQSAGQNPLMEALGEMKQSIGDLFFLQSDAYFHGGLDPSLVDPDEGHDPSATEPAEHETARLPEDWIGKINRHIRVVEHRHLEERNAKEILPFLYMATRLDPANAEAALASAYWIERESGRAQDAVDVLEKAAAIHPDLWEIHFELGKLYIHKIGNYERAFNSFNKACNAMTAKNSTPANRILAFFESGNALEKMGRVPEAVGQYEKALAFYPAGRSTALKTELEKRLIRFKQ